MSTGEEEGATRRYSQAGMMGHTASESSAAEHLFTTPFHTWDKEGGGPHGGQSTCFRVHTSCKRCRISWLPSSANLWNS